MVSWGLQAVCPLFVLKSTLLRNINEYYSIFILNSIIHSTHLLCPPFSVSPFCISVPELVSRVKQNSNNNTNNIHLTLFFNICRFVLLFPTFLQQKGLSNSFRIRRAWWFKKKRKKKKSPPALPVLIERRLLVEDFQLVAALPSVPYCISGNA